MSENSQRSYDSFFINTDPDTGPYLHPWSDGLHIQMMVNTRTQSPKTRTQSPKTRTQSPQKRTKSPPVRVKSPEPKKMMSSKPMNHKIHKNYTRYKISCSSLKRVMEMLKKIWKSVNIFDIKTIQFKKRYGTPHCYFSVNHNDIDEFCKIKFPKDINLTMC